MKQLAAITSFLVGLNLVSAEQIESWADKINILPAGTDKGVGGVVICRNAYTATIFIERYPHKTHRAELLFAHVSAWLMDNDSDRLDQKDAGIETEVDILDDETADIMLSIDFIEEIGIVPDSGGDICFNGRYWRLGEPVINYALTGTLHEPVDMVVEAI